MVTRDNQDKKAQLVHLVNSQDSKVLQVQQGNSQVNKLQQVQLLNSLVNKDLAVRQQDTQEDKLQLVQPVDTPLDHQHHSQDNRVRRDLPLLIQVSKVQLDQLPVILVHKVPLDQQLVTQVVHQLVSQVHSNQADLRLVILARKAQEHRDQPAQADPKAPVVSNQVNSQVIQATDLQLVSQPPEASSPVSSRDPVSRHSSRRENTSHQ